VRADRIFPIANLAVNVLWRKSPKRPTFGNVDRLIFAGLYGLAPNALRTLVIVRPETVIRWHRAGFRLYWRWKSKSPGGHPKLPVDIRALIRDLSLANPLWGAPRIHGELLKLGITIGQTTETQELRPLCRLFADRATEDDKQFWLVTLGFHGLELPSRAANPAIYTRLMRTVARPLASICPAPFQWPPIRLFERAVH
jgi:hypothetical protein